MLRTLRSPIYSYATSYLFYSVRILGAKRSVGANCGKFNLTDEPLDQPPADLDAARVAANIQEDKFFLIALGQTRPIDNRIATLP